MKTNLILIDEESIKDKLYYIRGQYVMIDSDLAKIYGYSTKAFNQQVKNNIEKFDDDFMFRLNDEESKFILRSNFLTSKKQIINQGGRRNNPYVFTEQGIYMLMTVLKGEKATIQSKTLIRMFKRMKDYLVDNNLIELNNIVLRHDNEIKILQETFNKVEEKELKNKIFFNGEIFDSYLEIIKILNKANNEIIIIDNYADTTLLEIISDINKNVVLITSKKLLKDLDVNKYNKQYNNLKVVDNDTFHDRFIILDKDKIYHLGSSINHIGSKTFAINIIEENIMKESLLNKINTIIVNKNID